MSILPEGVYNKMKTIKYRIYDPIEKRMIESGATPTMLSSFFKATSVLHVAHKMEYQQFTGLSDKAGKEIYEGDKYQWQGFEVRANKQIRPIRTGVVTWDYYELSKIQNIIYGNGTLEIISNIYENPELLEVKP